MSVKINQTQILIIVLSLTLGIIFGSIWANSYFEKNKAGNNTNLNNQIVATNQDQNQADSQAQSQINTIQTQTSNPAALKSIEDQTIPSTVTLIDKPVKTDTETNPNNLNSNQKNDLPLSPEPVAGKSISMKYLKITVDNILYTSNTPFKDKNSKIKDGETFVLLDVTVENISDRILNLDNRAYLIQIESQTQKIGNLEQLVYKPAKELGPTFAQSKYSLIRSNLKPKQKISAKVGFKIPKNILQNIATDSNTQNTSNIKSGTILNFYYPDLLESEEIAKFGL